jgi:hypothetical protein
MKKDEQYSSRVKAVTWRRGIPNTFSHGSLLESSYIAYLAIDCLFPNYQSPAFNRREIKVTGNKIDINEVEGTQSLQLHSFGCWRLIERHRPLRRKYCLEETIDIIHYQHVQNALISKYLPEPFHSSGVFNPRLTQKGNPGPSVVPHLSRGVRCHNLIPPVKCQLDGK